MSGVDATTLILASALVLLLGVATLVGHSLAWQRASGLDPAVLRNLNDRLRTWLLIAAFYAFSLLLTRTATVVLFAGVSFAALREYITVAPTRRADHRALFWAFFLFTPLQYILVWLEKYALYSVLVPIYACLLLPTRIAMSGDPKRFLERSAVIQTGLMLCVYCLSYAPAILTLPLDRSPGVAIDQPDEKVLEPDQPRPRDRTANYQVLTFMIALVVVAEVSQFAVSKLFRGESLAPDISAGRTYEGMLGGIAITTLTGTALYAATPFRVWQAAAMALITALMVYAGGLTMSAIKRDKRVSDYGTLVEGHGGVLDRIDGLCFTAPIFFHLTRIILIGA